MSTAERRRAILRLLCRRRHDTVSNLARELGVSTRTIRRDVDMLSNSEPIYTVQGKYGGVYIVDGYRFGFEYFSKEQDLLMKKICRDASSGTPVNLTKDELTVLYGITGKYSLPETDGKEKTR